MSAVVGNRSAVREVGGGGGGISGVEVGDRERAIRNKRMLQQKDPLNNPLRLTLQKLSIDVRLSPTIIGYWLTCGTAPPSSSSAESCWTLKEEDGADGKAGTRLPRALSYVAIVLLYENCPCSERPTLCGTARPAHCRPRVRRPEIFEI